MDNLFISDVYNPHERTRNDDDNSIKYGCFIDIGTRNMCFRFSNFYNNVISGTSQTKADYDLSKRGKGSREILESKSKIGIENDKFVCMVDHILLMKDDFINCHYIIIEQQREDVAKFNVKTMNILLGSLMTMVKDQGNLPIIILMSASAKTKLLGAPKGLKGEQIKEWCYVESLKILAENDGEIDKNILSLMPKMPKSGQHKKYDHSDVICYCKAWWKIIYPKFCRKYFGRAYFDHK